MTVAEQILSFYKTIDDPAPLPPDVGVMNPYRNRDTLQIASQFYRKYYNDHKARFICFGINPGRFGAGVTGIPFTDPIRLSENCGIKNDLEKKPELSSRFIYDMITTYGGPEDFYSDFYISAVSPLGFVREGVNLNYYDIAGYRSIFEQYAAEKINEQLNFGIHRNIAFSIGKGQNIRFLDQVNMKYRFFEKIIPLSHPRWVMQYRLKSKEEFIDEYLRAFRQALR